jgi:hypothetical protein
MRRGDIHIRQCVPSKIYAIYVAGRRRSDGCYTNVGMADKSPRNVPILSWKIVVDEQHSHLTASSANVTEEPNQASETG